MKFVFALALVAVCVMLMHARPNVRRSTDEVRRYKRERAFDIADELNALKGEEAEASHQQKPDVGDKGAKDGGKRQHETDNNGQSLIHQVSSENKEEDIGEANHEQKPDVGDTGAKDGGKRQHETDNNGQPLIPQVTQGGEGEDLENIGEGNEKVDKRRKRAATDRYTVKPWPLQEDGTASICYRFEPDAFGDATTTSGVTLRNLVSQAAADWNDKAGLDIHLDQSAKENCINIREPENVAESGCWAYIGYQGTSGNMIVLKPPADGNNNCFNFGVILHEIGHVIGLIHEAKRADAPQHINIIKENIQDDFVDQFTTDPNAEPLHTYILHSDVYDYCSIMHYSTTAFTKNGKDTIEISSNDADDKINEPCLGAQIDLSVRDGIEVAEFYKRLASENDAETLDCQNGGYALKDRNSCVCSNLFSGDQCQTPISNSGCGTITSDMSIGDVQTFQTPNYPSAYTIDTQCVWAATIPQDGKMCIAFPNGWDIEAAASNTKTCAFDWVEIALDRQLTIKTKRRCGLESAPWYYVANETVDFSVVVFYSDEAYPEGGFEGAFVVLTEDEDESDCKEKLEAKGLSSIEEEGKDIDYSYFLWLYYYYYG